VETSFAEKPKRFEEFVSDIKIKRTIEKDPEIIG